MFSSQLEPSLQGVSEPEPGLYRAQLAKAGCYDCSDLQVIHR